MTADRLEALRDVPPGIRLLVGNPYHSVHPLRRDWASSPDFQQALREGQVEYLDAHQLLLATNQFYFSGIRPDWFGTGQLRSRST